MSPVEASPTAQGLRSQTVTTLQVRFGGCPEVGRPRLRLHPNCFVQRRPVTRRGRLLRPLSASPEVGNGKIQPQLVSCVIAITSGRPFLPQRLEASRVETIVAGCNA